MRDIVTQWQGKELQFNDMTTDDQGSVYAGIFGYDVFAHPRPDPAPGALFRIDPPGRMVPMWDGIDLSNGLGFSPDRKLLYHSDSGTDTSWVYDVGPDRTLKDRRPFAKLPEGVPDGLAVDVEGGIWVAAAMGGEAVAFPQRRHIGPADQSSAQHAVERGFRRTRHAGSLYCQRKRMKKRYAEDLRNPLPRATIYRTRSVIPGLPVPKAQF